jgi:hypothetical protein
LQKIASWLLKAGYTSIELLSLATDADEVVSLPTNPPTLASPNQLFLTLCPTLQVRAVEAKGGRLAQEAAREIVSKAKQRQTLIDQCRTD